MNERTLALLRYHFDHGPHRVFTVASNTDEPDVLIVDYDHPGTRAHLQSGRWQTVPALMVLAYGSPPIDNAVVVHKPLDRARLDAAAHQLLHEAPPHPAGRLRIETPPVAASSDTPPAHPATSHEPVEQTPDSTSPAHHVATPEGTLEPGKAATPAATKAGAAALDTARHQAKIIRLCGEPRTIEELATQDDAHRYDPRSFFNHRLNEALARRQPDVQAIRLSVSEIDIYAMPLLNRIYMTESLKRAANVDSIFRPLEPDDVETATYGKAEFSGLLRHINGRARYTFTFEAYAWLGGLFTARGRLPQGIDIHRHYHLRRWPNFTRLELIPECMHIAAVWSSNPGSIGDTIRTVGCEPRYVASFYNGATALGILEEAGTVPGNQEPERS